jgi:hypothetical protein
MTIQKLRITGGHYRSAGGHNIHIETDAVEDLAITNVDLDSVGGRNVHIGRSAPPAKAEPQNDQSAQDAPKRRWWADIRNQVIAGVVAGIILLVIGAIFLGG